MEDRSGGLFGRLLEAGLPSLGGAAAARLAARFGTGFCYSLYHGQDDAAVVQEYRNAFRPSPEFPEPEVIIVVGCLCARDESQGQWLLDNYVTRIAAEAEPLRSRIGKAPIIVGGPDRCASRLAEIGERYGVGEVMIVDLIGNQHYSDRLEMYRLLARKSGLAQRAAEA